MKGVAAALRGVRFDAYAHHPYPFPVNQKPTQLVRYPNVTLKSMPRFEKDMAIAFRRKNIPIWITEYGNETKPGEPKGVTEAQQAAYIPQAIAMAKADKLVGMFIWFVMQDSQGSLWQSGVYRITGAAKPGQRAFDRAARGAEPGQRQGDGEGRHAEPARDHVPARVLREQPRRRHGRLHRARVPGQQARLGRPGRGQARDRLHRAGARRRADRREGPLVPRHGRRRTRSSRARSFARSRSSAPRALSSGGCGQPPAPSR